MHLKTVRLSALKDSPTAFGSTFARESQFSDEDWARRVLFWNCRGAVCFIALDEDEPCGIIAGKLDDADSQKADVLSMWVAPAHRRTGLGARLVHEVRAWALDLGVRELRLMVTNINSAAISFYRRCGFAPTGNTEPYPNDPALFEYEMVKSLSNS